MTSRHTHMPLTAARPRATAIHLAYSGPDTYTDGIDWIAVERAAEGTYNPRLLTPEEVRAAAILMTRAGISEAETANRLGADRRQISRWKTGQGVRPPAPCGHHRGYRRHLRRREETCAPCRAAYRAYRRDLSQRKQLQEAA